MSNVSAALKKTFAGSHYLKKCQDAVAAKDVKSIREQIDFLKYAKKLDHKDKFCETLLHRAYSYSARNVASVLLDAGADACLTNLNGKNILDRVISETIPAKRIKWLKLLEKQGVIDKIFASDPYAYLKKLEELILKNKSEVEWQKVYIKFLEQGSPTFEMYNFWCKECLNAETMAELIKHTKAFESFWSFLVHNTEKIPEAIIENALNCVKAQEPLLKRIHNTKMLMDLLKQGKTKAAEILIQEGVNSPKDSKEETVFQVALTGKQTEIVALLCKKYGLKVLVENPMPEYMLARSAGLSLLATEIWENFKSPEQDKLSALVDVADISELIAQVPLCLKSGAALTPEIIDKLLPMVAKSKPLPYELLGLILDARIAEGKLFEDLDGLLETVLQLDNPFSSPDSLASKLVQLGALSFSSVKSTHSAFEFILSTKDDGVIAKYIDNLVKRKQLDKEDSQHKTPFLLAVEDGCVLAIRKLLEAGASVQGSYPDENTILTFLVERNQRDILEIVCNAKTQQSEVYNLLKVCGKAGKTPDILAIDEKRTELLPFLVRVYERPKYQAMKVERRKNNGKTEIQLEDKSYVTIGDDVLGKGATGEVFKCTRTLTDGKTFDVAGKKHILDFSLEGKDVTDYLKKKNLAVVSFKQIEYEIGIHKRLSHPSILKHLGIAFYNGKHAVKILTFQELGEHSLLRVIHKNWGTPTYRLEMLKGVLEGLAYLHNQKIYHRDIKPDNLVFVVDPITGKRTLKIADLGLACEGDTHRLTGTPHYLAPDPLSSAKSDIFSLGVVFYEMLHGFIHNKPESPICTVLYRREPQKNTADHLIWQMTAPARGNRPDAKEALALLAKIKRSP